MQNENTTNSSQIQAGIQGNNSENQNANQNSPLNSSEFSSQNGGISPQNADIDNDTDSDNADSDSENENSPESDTKLSWDEFRQSDEFKKIRTYEKDGRIIYKPLTRQIRKLVSYNEVSLKDVDTSDVKNMKWTFKDSTRTDSQWDGIEKWDVSRVKGFEGMFYRCKDFNKDISKKWDVRNARTFQDMFYRCEKFDQPIGARWQTDSATNMIGMFRQALSFNNGGQPFGEGWKMDKVEWTWEMFWGARKFNQNINHWKMDNVIKCVSMFMSAESFNQPLDKWRMPKCSRFSQMFNSAESFDQDLSTWGEWIGNAVNMHKMFFKASKFSGKGLEKWDISQVQVMSKMFGYTKNLDGSFYESWQENISENCSTKFMFKNSRFDPELGVVDVSQIELNDDDDESDDSNELDSTDKLAQKIIISEIKSATKLESVVRRLFAYDEKDNKISDFNEWLLPNIKSQCGVFLFRQKEQKLEKGSDSSWDIALCKFFGHYFLVEKDAKFSDLEISKGKFFGTSNQFYIIQGTSVAEFGADFAGSEADYIEKDLEIHFAPAKIWILNAKENSNNDIAFDIINAVLLVKAYNAKMRQLDDEAREIDTDLKNKPKFTQKIFKFFAPNKDKAKPTKTKKTLQQYNEELCGFDLHSYRAVPIASYNVSGGRRLLDIWTKMSEFYMVERTHNELKDAITQVARLVAEQNAARMSRFISIVAILVSLFVGIFAPPIREWILNWQIWKTIFGG